MSEPIKPINNATPPKTWGISAAVFLTALRDKPVQVLTLDGKMYKGMLMGVDTYDVIIKQPNGLAVLITKHAIKIITADVG